MIGGFPTWISVRRATTGFASLSLTVLIWASPAHSQFRHEQLADGVEHWSRTNPTDGESFFTKWAETIYAVTFSSGSTQPFGRSIGFLVGVSSYHYLSPQLPSVDNDIEMMREFLLNKAGFDDIYIARNDVVDRDLVEQYIKDVLAKKLNRNDRLLFYYSGHGGDNDGKTGYMLFSKARKNQFWGAQVLAVDTLSDWSRELSNQHVLFILDACASGLGMAPKASSKNPSELLMQTLSGNGSRTMLTAGTADEETYAIEGRQNAGNGVFTKSLLNAFESRDVANQNAGFVTIAEVFAEVEKEMADFRAETGKATTPRMWRLQETEYRGTFVFLDPRTASATLSTEQARALGAKPIAKSEKNATANVGMGAVEISSQITGDLYIDDQPMGLLVNGETRKLLGLATGQHDVELRSGPDAKFRQRTQVDAGGIAYVSFGPSPIDASSRTSVGRVEFRTRAFGGEVFLDGLRVGHLNQPGELSVDNVRAGTHVYRIDQARQSSSAQITVKPGEMALVDSTPPDPPQNLKATVVGEGP